MWCGKPKKEIVARKPNSEPSMRTSVTLPSQVYSSLEIIAKQKKVSVAWVIRDATEKYIAEQWPLFAGTNHE
jgi:metal-responsive CopG/Arc/MetJ family transcriptional regulator